MDVYKVYHRRKDTRNFDSTGPDFKCDHATNHSHPIALRDVRNQQLVHQREFKLREPTYGSSFENRVIKDYPPILKTSKPRYFDGIMDVFDIAEMRDNLHAQRMRQKKPSSY